MNAPTKPLGSDLPLATGNGKLGNDQKMQFEFVIIGCVSPGTQRKPVKRTVVRTIFCWGPPLKTPCLSQTHTHRHTHKHIHTHIHLHTFSLSSCTWQCIFKMAPDVERERQRQRQREGSISWSSGSLVLVLNLQSSFLLSVELRIS